MEADTKTQLERLVVAGVLRKPEQYLPLVEPILNGGGALGGINRVLYGIAAGLRAATAHATVAASLNPEQLKLAGGHSGLSDLTMPGGEIIETPESVTYAARMLAAEHHRAEVERSLIDGTRRLQEGDDALGVISRISSMAASVTPAGDLPEIEILDLESIAVNGVPSLDWLLPGWLARQDIAVVAGRGGIGKSTLTAALCVQAAKGEPFLGIEFVRPLRVLYLDEEQGHAATARLLLRLGAGGLRETFRSAAMQGLRFDSDETVAKIERQLARFPADIVWVDSLNAAKGAAKENSADEMGEVMRRFFHLRDRHGCTVGITHHMSKSNPQGPQRDAGENVRGSSKIVDGASTAWVCTPSGTGAMDVKMTKRREASKLSMRVGYYTESEDAPIELSTMGDVDQAENQALTRCAVVMMDVARESTAPVRRKDLIAAAIADGHAERSAERNIDGLVTSGVLLKVGRGLFTTRRWADQQQADF